MPTRLLLTSFRRQLFRRLGVSKNVSRLYNSMIKLSSIDRMTEFSEVLKEDPYESHPLAAQVRGVKLLMHGVPSSRNYSPKSEKTNTKNIQEWNDKRVHIYHSLKATSNLVAFALQFMLPMDAPWIYLGIFTAIEKVCNSANITRLQFTNIYHFPVDLLGMCANLRELCLSGVSITNMKPSDPRLAQIPNHLLFYMRGGTRAAWNIWKPSIQNYLQRLS